MVSSARNLNDVLKARYEFRLCLLVDRIVVIVIAKMRTTLGILLGFDQQHKCERARAREGGLTRNVPQPYTRPVSASAKLQLSPAAT